MSTIGKRIHDRRVEMGMSADALAEKLGKNRATVYRYESDDIGNFPVAVIAPLAEILGVSPAYLMGWTDEPFIAKEKLAPKDEQESEGDEFNRLFGKLNPENQHRILDLMRVLESAQGQPDEDQE